MSAVATDALPHLRDMRESDLPQVMAIERVAYEFPWTEGTRGRRPGVLQRGWAGRSLPCGDLTGAMV